MDITYWLETDLPLLQRRGLIDDSRQHRVRINASRLGIEGQDDSVAQHRLGDPRSDLRSSHGNVDSISARALAAINSEIVARGPAPH